MLTYNLDMRGNETRYHYLYLCIKQDIESGNLAGDAKLPSKRTLAHHLGTSLITVESAYEQLIAEGYIRSEVRRGYFVNTMPKKQSTQTVTPAPQYSIDSSQKDTATGSFDPENYTFDLTQGQLSPEYFPYHLWVKAIRETMTVELLEQLHDGQDSFGLMTLRSEIARHLLETRGLVVNPEHVFIGAGAQVLYNLIIQLLGSNMQVGLEDPGYPRLTKIYAQTKIRAYPIPLDEHGIMVDALRHTSANVAHIMPSHQFPTGIIMPISRRYELLSWATEQPNRYILEDDYDCEFKLAGKPVPTLKGIDTNERVIYANTFSKSLGAAVRIAYIVLPEHLATRFRKELSFYSCTVSAFDQLTLATFMHNGSYERFINKTRTKCRVIRNALIDALSNRDTQNRLTFLSIDSGLHFVMSIRGVHNVKSLQKSFMKQGIRIYTLTNYTHNYTGTSSTDFIINYPNIRLERIDELADAIMRAVAATEE